jgi:hypothetical protein
MASVRSNLVPQVYQIDLRCASCLTLDSLRVDLLMALTGTSLWHSKRRRRSCHLPWARDYVVDRSARGRPMSQIRTATHL